MGTPLLSVQMQLEEMKRKKSKEKFKKKLRRVSSNLKVPVRTSHGILLYVPSASLGTYVVDIIFITIITTDKIRNARSVVHHTS